MGTRSTTKIYNEHGNFLVCLYRQYDGYPDGHGKELAEFLDDIKILNGYRLDQEKFGEFANGFSCLAAQIVSHFKEKVGEFYLEPENQEEEYNYIVRPSKDGQIEMECIETGFVGSPNEFLAPFYIKDILE